MEGIRLKIPCNDDGDFSELRTDSQQVSKNRIVVVESEGVT